MSEPGDVAERVAQIHVSSNVTSGVAALLFDILLLMLIKTQAQSLCSTANIHLIYDKRVAISPSTSRLGCFCGGPVGPRSLSRFLSLLIGISTACVIVLGFSINGKTIHTYRSEKFSSVVRVIEDKAADIDYEAEFSLGSSESGKAADEDDILISRRLAAIADSYLCLENNNTHSTIFGFAFKNDIREGPMVKVTEKIDGAECAKTPIFKESIVNRQYRIGSAGGPPVECKVESVEPAFNGENRETYANFTMGECDFEISEMVCYTIYRTACAAMGKRDDDTFILLVPNVTTLDTNIVQVPAARNKEDAHKITMNVAFLSATRAGGPAVSNMANIALTHVFHNQTLEYSTGEKDISELDLSVMIPVTCFIGGTTLLLMFTAVFLWLRVVYFKGRRQYNTFSTLPEVLQLANRQRKEKLRRPQKEIPYIGIGRNEPRIVVTSPERKEECTGADWLEKQIDAEIWPEEVEAVFSGYHLRSTDEHRDEV